MLAENLKRYLDENHVQYNVISHMPAYTAQTIAASAHVSGKRVAKNVIVKVRGELAMVVVPADRLLDLEELKEELGTTDVRLARESEFAGRFADCEVGFEPSFGNLYGLPLYVSSRLKESGEIIFNGGTRTDLVDMSFKDFERLTHPTII